MERNKANLEHIAFVSCLKVGNVVNGLNFLLL